MRRMLFINPLRVILSLTGIAIGITSVTIIVSLGEGARIKMLSQIESFGSNVITVDAGLVREVSGRNRQSRKAVSLKEKDAAALAENCSLIKAVAPTQEKSLVLKYKNASTIARVIGTSPSYPSIRNFTMAKGRFFTEDDNRLSLRYIVIGQKCVQYLFKNTDPVGETIKINNIPFEVIGVLNSRGASYDNANEDDMTFIPLNTGMRRVFNVDYIKNIYAQTAGKETIASAEKQIRKILRDQHRLNSRNYEDDFTIQNVYTAIKAESDTDRSFTFLVLGVAALSLLVGGVGLLATMLLSVKERKPEIGLRMAVGAKVRDILLQFLLESVLLSLLGGIAGIIAGVIGTIFIGIFTDLPARISYQSALITFIISVCIGVFFGTFPARKASTIQPVNALKD